MASQKETAAFKLKVTKLVKAHIAEYLDRPDVRTTTELSFRKTNVALWATLQNIEAMLNIVGTETSRKEIGRCVSTVGELVEALIHYANQPPVTSVSKPSADLAIAAVQAFTSTMVRAIQCKNRKEGEAIASEAREKLRAHFALLGIADQLDWSEQ